jgi:glycosyltransferase involved in cell wall biosynthesis
MREHNHPVSIIVPIYKVENFIERCVRSLFEQTLANVEYVFVDDCSPDRSMEKLRQVMTEYEHKSLTIKIVAHEQNKGLPRARNSGLAVATGEYIFHCDSDDWIEKDAMEKMYQSAQDNQVDIVWCDWFLSFQNNERYMQQKETETPIACIRSLLAGGLKYNVWNKLVKRSLYVDHHIRFPDGFGMGEDMTMIKLFAFAEKVSYLPVALYHYTQLNINAFTKSFSEQYLLQVSHNANNIIDFINTRYGNRFEMEIYFFKLNIKLPFLISKDKESYQRWLEWYPEANAYINQNTLFSHRARLIQQAAVKRQFWIIQLYYCLVIKVVYGIIYR